MVSLEGFRASRRKQNHLKGLEEGPPGEGKNKNKKTKSPRVDPPGLRGAGGCSCLPERQHPLLAGSGGRSRGQTSRVGGVARWGKRPQAQRDREPQRPPLSLPGRRKAGQRQDAAAGTPEPRGRSPTSPAASLMGAGSRAPSPRSPAARSLRTWPAEAAAARRCSSAYPFHFPVRHPAVRPHRATGGSSSLRDPAASSRRHPGGRRPRRSL